MARRGFRKKLKEYNGFDCFAVSFDVAFGKHSYEKMPGGARFDALVDEIVVYDNERITDIVGRYISEATKSMHKATTEIDTIAKAYNLTFDRVGRINLGKLAPYAIANNITTSVRGAICGNLVYVESFLNPLDLEYINRLEVEDVRVQKLVNIAKEYFVMIAMHYKNYRHIHAFFPEITSLFKEGSYDTQDISDAVKSRLKPRSSWILEGMDVDVFMRLGIELNISNSQRG